jgi:superfamily II DNA or RNA helicase
MTLQCPVELHEYQKEALRSWMESEHCGFFEMATGTGKTITALATVVEKFQKVGRGILVVLVPYLHLLEQWAIECRRFGFKPILCGSTEPSWHVRVKEAIREFNTNFVSYVCLIAVHKTATSTKFRDALTNMDTSYMFLVGDEAHGLGAAHSRTALINAEMRLGLSATPRRWFDVEGTKVLQDYFGKTCFEYPLSLAIESRFLTPYNYHPHIVHLTENERDEDELLSQKIASLLALTKTKNVPQGTQDKLEKLLIQRARIIGTAENKLPLLLNIMARLKEMQKEKLRDILVYCAPGTHKSVLKSLASLDLRCHEFVTDVSNNERRDLLQQFAEGYIQVLVSIRCLDEGVDVPSTRTAFILASSQNPREFIQRRGRILRTALGKNRAEIHDFLVLPDVSTYIGESFNRSILIREMPRFAEFSSCAQNEFAAREKVLPILETLGMRHLIDLKPWEVADKDVQEEWLIDEKE